MIRPATASDEQAWRALWRGYQAFYRVELPEAVTGATWRRLLDPGLAMHAALAVEDGGPVGVVHWLYHRTTWSEADTCYLQDLFVAPDWRGRGLARGLIETVYAHARERGAAEVYWLTHATNTAARRLYDRVARWDGFLQYQNSLDGT